MQRPAWLEGCAHFRSNDSCESLTHFAWVAGPTLDIFLSDLSGLPPKFSRYIIRAYTNPLNGVRQFLFFVTPNFRDQ